MKVTIVDVKQPDRVLDEDFPFEPSMGVPLVGDVINLRAREYQTNQRRTGTVVRRVWWAVADEPHNTEICLVVDTTRK